MILFIFKEMLCYYIDVYKIFEDEFIFFGEIFVYFKVIILEFYLNFICFKIFMKVFIENKDFVVVIKRVVFDILFYDMLCNGIFVDY